jgi:HlyD family secretion protein
VSVSCDGCGDGLHGTLSYVAADPQFTAPIIFSRDERGRLVYLAEARLDGDAGLLPGQPVSVEFGP